MSFPKYPKYKPSGVEWLGDVPEHWDLKPLRSIFNFSKGLTITKEDLQDEGIPCVNYGEIHSKYGFRVDPTIHPLRCVATEYQHSNPDALLRDGDFVFADTSEDLEGSGNFTHLTSNQPVFAGYHTIIGRPHKGVCPLFLAYQFHSPVLRSQIQSHVKGIKVFSISQAILKSVKCWLPSRDEQSAIASFLDRETSKIDSLVGEQRRLIELLKEKRQAVISHAVTKGLNPNAPMKPSGSPWLGDVPEHWTVASLRYFATFCTGSTPDRNNPTYWEGGIPWVKTGEIKYTTIMETEESISQEGLDSSSCSIASPGTLLMALYGQGVTRGRVAILGVPAAFNQACVAISVDKRIKNDFLHAFFVFAYSFIRDVGNETTQMNMNVEFVRRVGIVIPPIEEQIEIAAHVTRECGRFDALTAEAERAIELLQERRTALISAAVTGKIDVRQFVSKEAVG